LLYIGPTHSGARTSRKLVVREWPRGGVVTQRSAKPFTPVQFRPWPPLAPAPAPHSLTSRRPFSSKGHRLEHSFAGWPGSDIFPISSCNAAFAAMRETSVFTLVYQDYIGSERNQEKKP